MTSDMNLRHKKREIAQAEESLLKVVGRGVKTRHVMLENVADLSRLQFRQG